MRELLVFGFLASCEHHFPPSGEGGVGGHFNMILVRVNDDIPPSNFGGIASEGRQKSKKRKTIEMWTANFPGSLFPKPKTLLP